jgi:Glycosyl hydrolases family 18
MRSAFAVVVFLCFLPIPTLTAQAVQAPFLVSVYADVDTAAQSIPYDEIDELSLAFVNPVDACGNFSATTFPGIQAIVKSARAADGAKIAVSFAIGGGGNQGVNDLLESIAASATCRAQFASQVAAILAQNDLDGVNLDWEFPKTASLGNYTLMVQALRAAIGTKKTLSIAIYDDGGKENPADHMTSAVFPYVDYYMVMAYLDPRNAAIDSWVSPPWNLPESQLRLGLALFGDPDNGGASLGYNQILTTVPPAQASPCGDRVGIYTINGLSTTGELTRFAMTENLGGITAWELGDDRTDSISLLLDASDTARMWNGFAQWRPGTVYPAGTVVQDGGNLWRVKSSTTTSSEPSLTNTAFQQFEVLNQFSTQDYYCGGDEIWFSGSVYRAVQDPTLSVTDLSPTGTPSLWTKLYAAALYADSKTYKKGARVFFNNSVYVATKKTKGQSPAAAVANWSPFVDADAYDPGKSYSSGATVRYMGNQYVSAKASVGMNPVVATDVWQPVRK